MHEFYMHRTLVGKNTLAALVYAWSSIKCQIQIVELLPPRAKIIGPQREVYITSDTQCSGD
jgi:hypothetical protein